KATNTRFEARQRTWPSTTTCLTESVRWSLESRQIGPQRAAFFFSCAFQTIVPTHEESSPKPKERSPADGPERKQPNRADARSRHRADEGGRRPAHGNRRLLP